MYTKIYNNLRRYDMAGQSSNCSVKKINGNIYPRGFTVNISNFQSDFDPASLIGSNSMLCIGAGNTAATYDDYKLEDIITSNLTHVSQTLIMTNDDNDDGIINITRSITYTGTDPITIKEIGLFTKYVDDAGAIFLLARDVLSIPLEVTSGETFSVTMKLK